MGFGETFATWINAPYKNPRSKVRVNGFCLDSFRRGGASGREILCPPFPLHLVQNPKPNPVDQNAQIQGLEDEKGTIHKTAHFFLFQHLCNACTNIAQSQDTKLIKTKRQ